MVHGHGWTAKVNIHRYEFLRYLLPHQVEEIWIGLTTLGEQGFQNRVLRASAQAASWPRMGRSEMDMVELLTDYYLGLLPITTLSIVKMLCCATSGTETF